MERKLCTLLFLSFSLFVYSQELTRSKVTGKITASIGEDVEGINIYNRSSKKGTVTSKKGEFEIEVAENDRVLVSSMQYQRFTVIIDKGIIESKKMFIYLNPVVNQLDEVIIRPFDLSGNIFADVKRVGLTEVNQDLDLSYKELEFDYQFVPDAQTSVKGNKAEEAYFNNPVQTGGNFFGLAGLFFKNKKKTKRQLISEEELVTNAVQKRFGNHYIANNFNIPEVKVNEFIYFVEESGIDKSLLKPENELKLIEYLQEHGKLFLEQSKKE